MFNAAEQRALLRLMPKDEFAHLVDRVNAVQIAIALCHAPCEETMTAKDQPFGACVVLHRPLDEQCQFKSRTLPRHPDDLAPKFFVELFQLALSIRARSERNCPVRMQVIDMRKRKKCVQRSIDRRSHAIL